MTCVDERLICLDPSFLGSSSVGLVVVGMLIGALIMTVGRR